MPVICLDVEATGLDLRHGCRPFFVSICYEDGRQVSWEWEVNPLTREVTVPEEDKQDIRSYLPKRIKGLGKGLGIWRHGYTMVGHNIRYDITALASVGIIDPDTELDWERVHDTTLTDHLLFSNQPHNLTDACERCLRRKISTYEEDLQEAVLKARRLVKKFNRPPSKKRKKDEPEEGWKKWQGVWKVCEKGDPMHPSMKGSGEGKNWKADFWLPRAIAIDQDYEEGHPWYTVTKKYGNVDTAAGMALWLDHVERIKDQGLWEVYLQLCQKMLKIAYQMQSRGVTLSGERLEQQYREYKEESERLKERCVGIASSYGYDLTMPKSGNNNSLTGFCFGVPRSDKDNPLNPDRDYYLQLPVVKRTETGSPSLDQYALEEYIQILPLRSRELLFCTSLAAIRKRDKALSDIEGYKKFWIPIEEGWYRLHPNLNVTGTVTTRWSSNNPNEQNISSKEDFNLRYSFGPLILKEKEREWYSLDGMNLELRLPGYKAQEPDMIFLFEHPNDPPYYGSQHLAICDLLFPDLYKKWGKDFKTKEPTKYKWVKNGNFAVQYGAQKAKADATYHVKDAYEMIQNRFPRINALKQQVLSQAQRDGCIETMPDKTVGRGYPLWCQRTEYGKVEPTKPFSYYVQGTAGWWMRKCLVKVDDYLESIRTKEYDPYIIMMVHDELDLDFPATLNGKSCRERNLMHIKEVKRLMESCGDDLGIPIPVSCKLHEVSWDKGADVEFE